MQTPRHHLAIASCENCDYNVFLYASRNCYMCKGSSHLEECMYCSVSKKLKTGVDCSYTINSELCYECVDCDSCYNSNFCQDCKDTSDSEYCYDCNGCTNCFGCVGLRRAQYHIFNKPYTKEAYESKIAELKAYPEIAAAEFEKLKLATPRRFIHGHGNEASTGDYMVSCKNCNFSFGAEQCQDCAYIYEEMFKCRDSVDLTHSHNSELCYESGTMDNNYNCDFMFWATNSRDSQYCYCVHGCENIFMSTYMQHKKFHILNQPYEEKAYFEKVAEIKNWLREKNLYGQNLIYLALKDTPEVAEHFNALTLA